jgi:lysozyme family protein
MGRLLMANFTQALQKTLDFEGGYDNIPEDSGGETKELYELCNGNGEFVELVHKWYKDEFWDKVKGDEIIDQRVAFNIFDFAVNAGINRAVKYAQRIAKVEDDGVMGSKSIAAINLCEPNSFVDEYKRQRGAFYIRLADNKPSQKMFLNGWMNRVEEC